MGGFFDWVFWIAGSLLVAGGLALGVWAVFWDRPRGRRRCPRCWYDMTETPGLVCSECGHAVKRERKLRKTRRHLWPARLAVLVVLVGAGGVAWPKARQGLEKAMPTTLLIALMPGMDDWWPAAGAELGERFSEGKPWAWQWRWLIGRLHGADDPFCEIDITTSPRWPEGVALAGAITAEIATTAWSGLGWAPLRARIRPRFDPTAKPILLSLPRYRQAFGRFGSSPREAPWWRRTRALGMPPAEGERELVFDVLVERSRWRDSGVNFGGVPVGTGEGWQVIHKTTVTLPLVVEGPLESYIIPDDDPEIARWYRDHVTLVLKNGYLRVEPTRSHPPAGLTAPVVIELIRDGEPITSWLDWWELDEASLWPPAVHRIPEEITGDRRPFGTPDYASFSWSVRVRGDPSRAVPHELADRFWSGAYEVDLRLVETLKVLECRWP